MKIFPQLPLRPLLICLTLLLTPTHSFADQAKNIIGSQAPDFNLPDITGQQHSLSNWKKKFIILNFWATWCAPCKKEIPIFNKIQDEFSDDVQFIGIAIDNSKDVKTFTKLIPINYPNLIGGFEASQLVVDYGNKAGALPYTVFINQNGKIIGTASGQITTNLLIKTIEKNI